MANLTTANVEAAMAAAPSLGDRLVALVSLRKQAQAELQATANLVAAGTITDDAGEILHDTTITVLARINSHRTGVEALI